MGASKELTPAARRFLYIEGELIRSSLLTSPIESFTQENPLYRVVDPPVFDPRRAQNVLESIHPSRGISQGIKDLEQIHRRCLAKSPSKK